jgi:hypothetical protein
MHFAIFDHLADLGVLGLMVAFTLVDRCGVERAEVGGATIGAGGTST